MGKIRGFGFATLYHIDPQQFLFNIVEYWNTIEEDGWDEIKNARLQLEIIHLREMARKIVTDNPTHAYKFVPSHYIDEIVKYTGVTFDIDITDRESQERSGIKPIRIKNKIEYLFVDNVKPLYLKIAGISPPNKIIEDGYQKN